MSEPAILVDGVWKKFRKGEMYDSLREWVPALIKRAFKPRTREELANREFWALQDVSFTVERGQSMGIIGPNGAGKSTMLKLLSRIIKPTRGTYNVRGRLSSLIEVGAGFHGDLTGRENIYLNGAILGMSKAELRSKEDAIIEFAGIPEFIDTPVKRYSSGMTARLGFAVAAHMDPDVLLIDEVLSVGDARFRDKCVRHMKQLIESDVTVIFISHILDQVRSLCPNTLVLDRGAVIFHGPTDQAIRRYLDALGDDKKNTTADESAAAELRNIRFCDLDGREVLEWKIRQPAVIEFDLVIHRFDIHSGLIINIATVGGNYLGTVATGFNELGTPHRPGTYRIRLVIEPMRLDEGDYSFGFELWNQKVIWALRQPRVISIKGSGKVTAPVIFDGQFSMLRDVTSESATGPASNIADARVA